MHQLPSITKTIRLLDGISASLPDGGSASNQPGSSALQRRLLNACTTLLLLSPAPSSGKETNELLNVILGRVEDPRPKVRKAAWGSLVEICMVLSEDNIHETTDEGQATKFRQHLMTQRKGLVNKIWTFCHNVLTSKKKRKLDTMELVHVLTFLENAVPYCESETCVKFGEVCLTLLASSDGNADMVRQSLSTSLSCLEVPQQSPEGEVTMAKFASRALAFLLQHRPNADSAVLVYARCLLSCMGHMAGNTHQQEGVVGVESKLLAFKLLPQVMKSMLHLCDTSGEGIAESCGAEFNQLLSRIMTIIVSAAYGKVGHEQLSRVATETIPQCIPVVQEALHIQYRNGWGSILPGGYATFTISLAVALLEWDSKDKEEEERNLRSHVKSMVLALLRLRQDVEKDGTARNAVEYATSTIVRGMGVELFMALVDFVDEDSDAGQNNSTVLSCTTGGGIRDDRAWLLPLLKQSAPLLASESTMELPVFTESCTTKTHLSFFQGRVLNLARRCDAASADGHRTAAEASIQKSRVVELWALLPAFCLHPMDMKENFAALAKTMMKALGDNSRYPKLIVSLCNLFQSYQLYIDCF